MKIAVGTVCAMVLMTIGAIRALVQVEKSMVDAFADDWDDDYL